MFDIALSTFNRVIKTIKIEINLKRAFVVLARPNTWHYFQGPEEFYSKAHKFFVWSVTKNVEHFYYFSENSNFKFKISLFLILSLSSPTAVTMSF